CGASSAATVPVGSCHRSTPPLAGSSPGSCTSTPSAFHNGSLPAPFWSRRPDLFAPPAGRDTLGRASYDSAVNGPILRWEPVMLRTRKLVLFAVMLIGLAGCGRDPARTAAGRDELVSFENVGVEVGQTAPDIVGEAVQGGRLKLSDYRGKVVVLEFW